MILSGYCLKPVQLFASRLARYRTFGIKYYIQLYAIFKNRLQVSMGNHFCLGIGTKVMKTLHRHFHSPVSSKMEMKVQWKDVLFLSKVSTEKNARFPILGNAHYLNTSCISCKYVYKVVRAAKIILISLLSRWDPRSREQLLSCKRSLSVRASYLTCFVRPCSLSIYFVCAFYPFLEFENFQGLSGPK